MGIYLCDVAISDYSNESVYINVFLHMQIHRHISQLCLIIVLFPRVSGKLLCRSRHSWIPLWSHLLKQTAFVKVVPSAGTKEPEVSMGPRRPGAFPAFWPWPFPSLGCRFFLFNMRRFYETAPGSLLAITGFAFSFLAALPWTPRLSPAWTMREELQGTISFPDSCLSSVISWTTLQKRVIHSIEVHEVYEEEKS